MGINLSIKNVPEEQVERLRARAKANHRSLQGELKAILDLAVGNRPDQAMTLREVIEQGRQRGLSTPDEATQWIREDRDSR